MKEQDLETMISVLLNLERVQLDVYASFNTQLNGDESFSADERDYMFNQFKAISKAIYLLIELFDKKLSAKVGLKAGEVLEILNIDRNTLNKYVKSGLIKLDPNPNGKQNRYNAESVYNLINKENE